MTEKIVHISLDPQTLVMRNAEIAHEKDRAVKDILEQNSFSLKKNPSGPYAVHFIGSGSQLILEVHNHEQEKMLQEVGMFLSPFRSVIRDYHLICDSYFKAIESANPSKVEAIDMGRRGVHNEGSEVLIEQLGSEIECDFETARRLFTLISVLHMK